MTCAVAIFVKTPGHSPLKTRLAATEGQVWSEGWHQRAAEAVASVVRAAGSQGPGLRGYWAVAESSALDDARWGSLPRLAQGEGGLGPRLHQVYSTLIRNHRSVLLIGADSPQMIATMLIDGAAWLTAGAGPRAVVGPSEDGGFWVAGGNVELPRHVWTQVAYSGRETGLDMQASLAPHALCRRLPRLFDLDHADDISRMQDALQQLDRATIEQRALLDWMRSTRSGIV